MKMPADIILTDNGATLPPCTSQQVGRFLLKRGSGTDDTIYVGVKLSGGSFAWGLLVVSGRDTLVNTLEVDGAIDHDGSTIGFYGTAPATKQTVTGSRGGNAALNSLCTALAAIGLITNSTSA